MAAKSLTSIKVAANIAFACLSVIFVLIIAETIFSYSNIPGIYKTFLVQSGSMSPAIKTGDLIIVQSQAEYKKGDVITFTDDGSKKVTHRIAEVRTKNNSVSFLTKGDANQVTD